MKYIYVLFHLLATAVLCYYFVFISSLCNACVYVCNCWSRFFFCCFHTQVQWKEMSFCFIFYFILPPQFDDLLVFLILSRRKEEMHLEFLWKRVSNLENCCINTQQKHYKIDMWNENRIPYEKIVWCVCVWVCVHWADDERHSLHSFDFLF